MKTCDVCGKEFYGSRKEQVTCSSTCRLKKWRAKHETFKQYYDRKCVGCGKEFKATDRRKVFCGGDCRHKYRNKLRPTTQLTERPCVVCGTLFKPLQKRGVGRKWCTEECRLTILRGYKPRRISKEQEKKSRACASTRAWVKKQGGHKVIDLKRKFGITLEQYNAMYEAQGGKCAICGQEENIVDKRSGKPRMLSVDHHHSSGRVRKLLCTRCNQGIGNFKENPEIIRSAIAYLDRTE